MTTALVNKDLIHIQNSHVTQHNKSGEKTPWRVEKNITNERLFSLPANFSEADVFTILEFARKYELIAWNEGIALGKKLSANVYKEHLKEAQKKLEIATQENERLANILEKKIGKKE